MKERIKRYKLNILAVLLIIYGISLVVRMLAAAYQTADYANEYRESANIAMSLALAKGINPYSLDTINSTVPAVCYLYGPLMSIIAAVISKILPVISMQAIHYGISFLSIIISAVLISKVVYDNSKTIIAPLAAFVLTMFCHWRYGYIYGAPDSFGLCIMICTLYVLAQKGYKYRPYLAAFLAVLTFFTKQYFLMIALTGAVYLFIVSKKEFVKYAIAGVVISGVVAGILTLACPLYWTYAIYFLKGPGAGAAMGHTGISYNNMQISYLGGMFLALFIVGAYVFIKDAVESIKNKKLMTGDTMLLFWIQLVISGIVLRYIGNNAGAFLSYYLQLFMPALVVIACCGMDEILTAEHKSKYGYYIAAVLYVVFLLYTVYKVEPRLIINKLSDSELSQWQQAYETLDKYSDGEIYYMPPLAYHGYSRGAYVYNDGQPFVIGDKFYKSFNNSKLAQTMTPYGGKIMEQHLKFRQEIVEKVKNGEYSLLMTMDDMDTVFTEEDLSDKYKKLTTYSLRTGNWAWDIDFWVRK